MAERDDLLSRAERRARKLLERPQLVEALSRHVQHRALHYRGQLGDAFAEVQSLMRLVKAWASGRYRVVPMQTLVAVVAALIYFLIPTDAIPDFIAGIGFIDDLAVIARVVKTFRGDLEAFRVWEAQNQRDANNNEPGGEDG